MAVIQRALRMASRPPLSVVVPVNNEAGSIERVLTEIITVLRPAVDLDLIAVDDGSSDATVAVMQSVAAAHPELRVVVHAQRAGKSAALRTGAAQAKHVWLATIDGDGENDPKDILAMIEGLDLTQPPQPGAVGLVAGIRRRRTAGVSRLIASRIGNGLRRLLLRDTCPDTACGLKVIPKAQFRDLPFFDALHRFLPALTRGRGYDVKHVSVDDRPRLAGQSKYTNLGRALVGIVDLLGVVWLLRRGSSTSVRDSTNG